ncbi:hypothetical protein CARUB_v10016331mg [Capsella rubella]|uniref:Replication protein A 70 kDa DNA-binding subunit B/D first OB fold domain-containing protein n=1 Tax=Capsella rubella TaxID=81985 RepID=R0I4T8_9BRAS|nr:hypothetical protein CARUB_v10016331mg [Capsella rubella]
MSMALPLSFTPLKDLKPYKNSWRIQVKILHSWRMFSAKFSESIELILADEEGDKMGASIRKDHSLREGEWKIITSFGLHPSTGMFRPSHLKYKITTRYGTTINQSEKISDDHYLSFAKFDDILAGTLDKNILFDVIGQVVSSGGIEVILNRYNKETKKIVFELRDNDDIRLSFTLWENYADLLNKAIHESNDGMVICLLRFVKQNLYKRIYIPKTLMKALTTLGLQSLRCLLSLRYKLHLSIMDHTGESKYFLFDSWAKKILGGAPASEFLNGSFDEIEDPNAIPDQIKALIGKTFQFLITVGNKNVYGGYEYYKVSNVWSGEKFIKLLMKNQKASLMITNGTEPYETDLSSTSTPSSKRKSDSSGNGTDRSSSTKKMCSKIDTIQVDGSEVVRKDLNEEITREDQVI